MELRELAQRLGCQLEGDGDIDILRVATLEDAGPGDLTFLANPKYAAMLPRARASAVIAAEGVHDAPCAVLRTAQPYLAFARAIGILHPTPRPGAGIHPLALVALDAELDVDVSIGPFAVVEAGAQVGARTVVGPHTVIGAGAVVGPDSLLHAHVSIRERVVLGARVVVQNGAVIGSDGFGFARREDGTYEKIPQIATVVIEDDVEIGANTTIDRPAVGETRVRAGAKIDNLVQLAHGVVVGRDALVASQVGVAGSTRIGDRVVLGGQVGTAGHITIGDRARVAGKTGVTASVPAGSFVTGYPHMDNLEWRKANAVFRRLPDFRRRLRDLEARLAALENVTETGARGD